jgi:GTP cyclohydrolase I
MSNKIIDKIIKAGGTYFANDNISQYLTKNDIDSIQEALEVKFREILDILVIDSENDHNTNETPQRIAKMYIREVFKGRYEQMPTITDFPNAKSLNEIYTLGPITVRSACSHHFVPITGKLWIGILPSDKVIGISKFVRLAEWVLARPQIQEESTVQLADIIETMIEPKGLAILMEATHQCMTWRGVKETETKMTTSVMRGQFENNRDLKNEFLRLVK